MKRKRRPLLLAFVVLMALAGFALLAFTASKPAPLPPLPNPNGYDDFAKAGQMRAGNYDYTTGTENQLRAYVMTNATTLVQVRVGLSRKCRVPLDFANTNWWVNLAELKALALLLAAEGRLAEAEHRPTDAAHSYIDVIRLGSEMSRGGLLIHRLVGIADEAIGYNLLTKLAPTLDCEQLRPIIADLQKVDEGGVTWDEVAQNEQLFMRHEMRKSANPLRWAVDWWQTRPAIKKAKIKHDLAAARRRLLMVELALRCHQSDRGHAPEQLDQLVPKYLQHVPTDPFSGQSLIYRAQGTNWLLYSIGPDGVDDGGRSVGKPVSGSQATGDLLFDASW